MSPIFGFIRRSCPTQPCPLGVSRGLGGSLAHVSTLKGGGALFIELAVGWFKFFSKRHEDRLLRGCRFPWLASPGSRHQARATRHQAPGNRHQAPGTRHQARGTMHQPPGTMHLAACYMHQALGISHQARGTRHQTSGMRHEASATRHQTPATSIRNDDSIRHT
jgi:hypothetical protein